MWLAEPKESVMIFIVSSPSIQQIRQITYSNYTKGNCPTHSPSNMERNGFIDIIQPFSLLAAIATNDLRFTNLAFKFL